jgi:ribosomal protein S15P/S13E
MKTVPLLLFADIHREVSPMLPFFGKKQNDKQVLTKNDFTEARNVRIKVEQDIAFLSDRIESMKKHSNPNTQLIAHYESMLSSREAVLRWLMDGCDDETTALPNQRSA